MSPYITHLASRALGTPPGIRPRLPALFEPTTAGISDIEAQVGAAVPRAAAVGDEAPTRDARPVTENDMPAGTSPPRAWADDGQGVSEEVTTPVLPGARPDSSSPVTPAAPIAPTAERPTPVAAAWRSVRPQDDAVPAAASSVASDHHVAGDLPPPPMLDRPAPPSLELPQSVLPPAAPDYSPPARVRGEGPPAIKITIGRIDVRAVSEPKRDAPPLQSPTRPRPALVSLEDYLKRGKGGGV